MDKNFDSFEYLPANSSQNDQYFVVQDNGTFMITRQAVQYTTQNHNDKEALETVQVFNVTPQQFLVDVDNSSELISVSDQFIIPNTENNLYANSYLLQPETSTPTEQMDQDPSADAAVEFKPTDSHINLEIATQTSKQASTCTEITLTDEQYQMLEQKGWILLEINEKIYVLDTLGLHDITTNHKLIEKLKTEAENNDIQEIHSKLEVDALENNVTQDFEAPIEDSSQYMTKNKILIEQTATIEHASLTNDKTEDNADYNGVNSEITDTTSSPEHDLEINDCDQQDEDNESNARILVIENENIQRVGNKLKVKTKLSLKDFPEKIVLGKMANGKNLVAKVVKPTNGTEYESLNSDQNNPDENSQSSNDLPNANLDNSNILNESEFYLLMKHFFQNNISKCNGEDVVTADSIISQLLQIPSFKSSVMDNNLVITKTIQNEDSSGEAVNKGLSAFVTGRVSQIADQWRFVHLPNMLQDMVTKTEDYLSNHKKNQTKEDFNILHVQISEAKEAVTDIVRVSVTVNKRKIPMNFITNKPKPQPSTMYACSFCAALFNTEIELKDHQTNNCLKHEEMLTIDMEQLNKPCDFCIINTGRTKSYACMQCNARFNRLTTCKNHLKTHYSPKIKDATEKSEPKNSSKNGIYKCNMCPSTYFHPSTLSKHILARHIKIKG